MTSLLVVFGIHPTYPSSLFLPPSPPPPPVIILPSSTPQPYNCHHHQSSFVCFHLRIFHSNNQGHQCHFQCYTHTWLSTKYKLEHHHLRRDCPQSSYVKNLNISLRRYADDNLNRVAAELDSFDGRKDPERCAALVSRYFYHALSVVCMLELQSNIWELASVFVWHFAFVSVWEFLVAFAWDFVVCICIYMNVCICIYVRVCICIYIKACSIPAITYYCPQVALLPGQTAQHLHKVSIPIFLYLSFSTQLSFDFCIVSTNCIEDASQISKFNYCPSFEWCSLKLLSSSQGIWLVMTLYEAGKSNHLADWKRSPRWESDKKITQFPCTLLPRGPSGTNIYKIRRHKMCGCQRLFRPLQTCMHSCSRDCVVHLLLSHSYWLCFASTSSNFPEWRIDAVACHITIPSLHCACALCTVHCAYVVCMWSHLRIAPLSVIIPCPRQKYCCHLFLEWGWSS